MGALDRWPGELGLAITLVSWVGLARDVVDAAARRAAIVADALDAGPRRRLRRAHPARAERADGGADRMARALSLPLPIRPRDVERVRNVVYADADGISLRLDVYRAAHVATARCPTLLQIHGGAWILGSKNEQGIPLMLHLAARGWVCVSVDYRLSPRATFPDHLVDLKRAIAWIREHVAEYGADPDFVVVDRRLGRRPSRRRWSRSPRTTPSTSPASRTSTPRCAAACRSTASTTSPTATAVYRHAGPAPPARAPGDEGSLAERPRRLREGVADVPRRTPTRRRSS